MAMSKTMKKFLTDMDVDFEEVVHPRDVSANRIAQKAHVSGHQVAKAVLIKGDSGYRVLVLPSTAKVDLNDLSHRFHERLGLAREDEIHALFMDCEAGALPTLAQAYGLRVCYDDSLLDQRDIYVEAGDHETLLRMGNNDFHRLMGRAEHGRISRPM